MQSSHPTQLTRILQDLNNGDRDAPQRLWHAVYDEFRKLAASYLRRERNNHTLQPTALVHEAYLKLIDQEGVDWKGRTHFFAVGAQAMRRILVDHARRHLAEKRGGHRQRIELDEGLFVDSKHNEDLLSLEDAMTKLAELDPQQAKMVELRFYGGLKVDEVAEVLKMSKRSVEREWTMVRAWLRRELNGSETK
jgi:RNA polymerase sigma-70 factor (ECF subfamily)